MNSPKKSPQAPPAYRPQPLPRVLQRKSNSAAGQGLIYKASPARIVQLSGPKRQPVQAASGRHSIVQLAQAPVPAPAPDAAAPRSGRTPEQLWDLFNTYDNGEQAKTIERAFLRVGYTIDNVRRAILKAIKKLGLDLAAHGSGGGGDGVQGGLADDVQNWVSKLTQWAQSHPVGARGAARGERHDAAQQEQARQKRQDHKQEQAQKKNVAYQERCKDKWKHVAGLTCPTCGYK